MKRLLVVTLTLLMAFMLAGPALAADPVKIGVLVPLTGIVANGGKEMKNGIDMAAKEKKTLLGRPIKLIVEDTRVKPAIAVSKAEKLVFQDGCKALIGVFSSGVGLALAKNIDKLNVPFLTTHVMTTALYGLNPLVFRSGQLANDQTVVGNVKGIVATPDLMKRKYYVLVHDYAWGHDGGKRFVKLAKENGIKLVNPDFDRAPIATKKLVNLYQQNQSLRRGRDLYRLDNRCYPALCRPGHRVRPDEDLPAGFGRGSGRHGPGERGLKRRRHLRRLGLCLGSGTDEFQGQKMESKIPQTL